MKHVIFILMGLLLFSVVLNIYLLNKATNKIYTQTQKDTQPEFRYLAKRIFVENPNDIFINFMPLRDILREEIRSSNIKMGLYFEYLPSGISIGINDTNEIPMASLIKVPTVIGIYRKINTDEIKKTEMLTIQKDDIDSHFGDLWKKGEGTTISVEDAIKLTISQSDNTAHSVLYKKLTDSEKFRVYAELDIRLGKTKEDTLPIISAKSYSSILKSLYYSSYLPPSYSEEILKYMTESIDKEKLVAGVDSTIPVAHKTGIYEKVDGNFVYSDCGIVYIPKRQYILCMMTEDSNKEISTTIMANLSKIVNSYITSIKNE